jgi:hypothetical protein
MLRDQCLIVFLASAFFLPFSLNAQTPAPSSNDTIRVTVTVNADGSRTTYQFDNAKHEAIATTADPDGKTRGRVVYRIDDSGRFETGVASGPDGKFLFKTVYKYDAAGRLEQETHLDKGDAVIDKTVYKYDPAGKPIGVSTFDATGKLVSGTTALAPTAPPKSRNTHGR